MGLRKAARLAWRVFRNNSSNLVAFAERELHLKFPAGDDMDDWMREGVLELVKVFASHGHSGSTAGIAISVLEQLLRYEPLAPLTGDDDEWMEYMPGEFQNKRCPHVFKDAGGPYDGAGYTFVYPDGTHTTGHGSRKAIAFPYTPGATEYINVDGNGVPLLKKWHHLREPKNAPA